MEEKRYKLSVTKDVFNNKFEGPTKMYFGRVDNSLQTTEKTITEFSQLILRPNAHSWSGGVFNGKRSKASWLESSVIGLDFDKGLETVEEVYNKFKEFDITPNLWYTTFGDSPELRKFRVVLFFDQPIKGRKVYDKIMKKLEQFFCIDTACKDESRIFYGGNASHITSTVPISLSMFLVFINVKIISKDNGLPRGIIKLKENPALISQSLYNNYSDDGFKAENSTSSLPSYLSGRNLINWDEDRKKIKILDEFLSGAWLTHPEILGLASNLKYVEGGLKKMSNTMKHFNDLGRTGYTDDNYSTVTYIRNSNYKPQLIHSFSPYEEDEDLYDIVSAIKNVTGFIKILDQPAKMELEPAKKVFEKNFNEVLNNSETNTVYIYALPTAFGKTHRITGAEKVIIALPTNALKNEVGGRMSVDYTSTPDSIVFSDSSITKRIGHLYDVGLPTKAMGVIRAIADGRYPSNQDDKNSAINYILQLEACGNLDKSVLTTHSRVTNSDSLPHDTIIFDEDPLSDLVEIKKTTIDDISLLFLQYEPVKNVRDYLVPLSNDIYDTPKFPIDLDEMIEKCSIAGLESNVFSFFKSDCFIKFKDQIHYIIKKPFPIGKKVIIMSATIPIEIYKKLYPETNFKILDIRNVEQVGHIKQYTYRSFSRDSLMNYKKMDNIISKIGNSKVITFKDHVDLFPTAEKEIYFGNCSGSDKLKGQNITIVGTPHKSNIMYFLLGKAMGVDFEINNSPMSYQKIQRNGFEFMFKCFDNEQLRMIQLSLIESDQIQAIGRGRALIEPCLITVYSNLPLFLTDEFDMDKIG